MGSIKPTYVKAVGKNLLSEYPDDFTADFDENKKKVMEYANISSKKVRNSIAGYITKKVNSKMKREGLPDA